MLFDDFEQGMTTAEVRAVLRRRQGRARAVDRGDRLRTRRRRVHLRGVAGGLASRSTRRRSCERFGFDRGVRAPRPDGAPVRGEAPAPPDIRLTTRYNEDGITRSSRQCTSAGTASTSTGSARARADPDPARRLPALHESQSRMWENLVGRSRPFWHHFYPRAPGGVPGGRRPTSTRSILPRRSTGCEPSLDPRRGGRGDLQPPHHAPLRAGAGDHRPARSPPRELPGGLEHADPGLPRHPGRRTTRSGCSRTCTGGPAASATSRPTRSATSSRSRSGRRSCELPDLADQFEAGEFGQLHEWLRTGLYRLGRKYTPQEMLERVAGGPIDAGPSGT